MLDPQRVKLAGAEIPPGLSEAVGSVLKSAIAQSFVSSFRLVMLIASGKARSLVRSLLR